MAPPLTRVDFMYGRHCRLRMLLACAAANATRVSGCRVKRDVDSVEKVVAVRRGDLPGPSSPSTRVAVVVQHEACRPSVRSHLEHDRLAQRAIAAHTPERVLTHR